MGFDRAAVTEAAGALADEHGLRNVTLAMVAGQLGMRSQSLYAHVDGIDGLRRELALLGQRLLADELREAVMARSGIPALHALCRSYAAFVATHPGIYEATMRQPGDDPEIAAANERVMGPLMAVLASFGFEGDEIVHRYRIIWSSLHGFVTVRQAGLMSWPVDADESFARLLQIFGDDLEAHGSAQ